MPNGEIVERDAIRVETRFVEYGPEDFDYLVATGMIREDRSPCCFVMDTDRLEMNIRDTLSQLPKFKW